MTDKLMMMVWCWLVVGLVDVGCQWRVAVGCFFMVDVGCSWRVDVGCFFMWRVACVSMTLPP